MKKVRIGVIGVGSMGSEHLNSISKIKDAKLCAVCDIDKKRADKYATEHKVKAYYNSDKLIKSGDVDAVLIATPHYDHTPISIAAMKAGLHVLTEKPIAVHKADAQKMIDAYKKSPKLKFAAMFNQRTVNAHKKIKKLLDDGEIGEIRRVNWIITSWYRTQTYYNSGGWRATWEGEGGGVLINQCPHQLDLFQWFFGMPVKVWAKCSLGKYHDIEVEDDVTAVCEFKNGATGIFITTTGEAPGTNRLEVIGTRGKLIFENGKIIFKRLEGFIQDHINTHPEGFGTPELWNVEIPYPGDSGPGPHQKIIANFVDAILNDTELIAPAEEGINGLEFGNSMLLSGLTGKEITLPMDAAEYEKQLDKLISESTFAKKEVKKVDDDSFLKSF